MSFHQLFLFRNHVIIHGWMRHSNFIVYTWYSCVLSFLIWCNRNNFHYLFGQSMFKLFIHYFPRVIDCTFTWYIVDLLFIFIFEYQSNQYSFQVTVFPCEILATIIFSKWRQFKIVNDKYLKPLTLPEFYKRQNSYHLKMLNFIVSSL